MEIVNTTPFQAAPLAGRLGFPKHSLTVIVKGTFDLRHGSQAAAAGEQAFPSGDLFYPDDEEQVGGPWYESDFAYFKPKADLLLVGRCHTPEGKPAPACPVTFRVGGVSRTLYVFGERRWKGPFGLRKIADPVPFTELALRYENSFGREGYKKNPVGKGLAKKETLAGDKEWPLPNIEDPDNLIGLAGSRPEPAGFGPVNRTWEQRRSKLGKYRKTYTKERWPWFPEDFDFSYFNAAPEALQVEDYLKGDEPVFLGNLHPEHARYETRLPGIRVRCFLNGAEEGRFEELPMVLDTLWVDMDEEKMVLLWRGSGEVRTEEYEEVDHLFVLSEPLDRDGASLKAIRERFIVALKERDLVFEPAEEAPEEEPIEEPEAEEAEKIDPKGVEAQVAAVLAKVGIDWNSLPPKTRENALTEQGRIITKMTGGGREMEQREAEAMLQKALAEVDVDPKNLPPLSEKALAEQLRFLKEMGLDDGAAVAADANMLSYFTLMAAVLPKAGIDPEDLTPLIKEAGKLKHKMGPVESGEPPPEKEVVPSPWTRERVEEQAAKGEPLAGENLAGLDLRGIDLSGANLAGADLTGANLDGADLRDVDCTEAVLDGASLKAARLKDAVFEKARLVRSVLEKAEAEQALFIGADLTEARMAGSMLKGADFTRSTLRSADLKGAVLTEACLDGAACPGADFSETKIAKMRASEGSDLSKASFAGAEGPDSMWQTATLKGADLSYARMERADFTAAVLEGANLHAADMKQARFMKADLREAKGTMMNLFQGNLEKADLTRCDLSGSNLYGAEFLGAVMEKTRLKDANLKMTKLS